ncbi:FAD-dependent oxidoreductase [Paraburkholderia oxyphila]|uniref:FAD-dependent oxidoreductase n=1 Tax=Paraburkholderia oxyphila TaxID=614212 RepID=UPI000486484D|nr:FAD-dependent oxidoreductase [Paraburkholderia oxyphila]
MSSEQMRDLNEYDVLVVGAGLAGYAAAISASECGASVLLLEKMHTYGGSTAWSGGAFCFADTEDQAAAGIKDCDALLRMDLTRGGEEKSNPELIDLYLTRQREIYRWLKGLGVTFTPPVLSPGQSVPRSHGASPRVLLDLLHEHFLRQAHCRYIAGADVLGVERDGEGVARILRVCISGETNTLAARRAVVIATGGFSRSQDLFKRYAPWLENAKRMGGEGATGDGLKMGIALGGDITDFDYLEGSFGAILPNYPSPKAWSENDTTLMHAEYSGAIVLNKLGRRFVNESQSYRKLGAICLKQPGAVAFQLFDQSVMDTSRSEPVTRNFKAAFDRNLIHRANSIREAAQIMGLPADVVEAEVAEYNRHIEYGEEPAFGRNSLLNGEGKPFPLVNAPFYIYACTTGISSTLAGLVANGRMALLDTYGDEVPGVFLAGEVVGGFHGPISVSGTALSKAAIFGKTAGENAARFSTSVNAGL